MKRDPRNISLATHEHIRSGSLFLQGEDPGLATCHIWSDGVWQKSPYVCNFELNQSGVYSRRDGVVREVTKDASGWRAGISPLIENVFLDEPAVRETSWCCGEVVLHLENGQELTISGADALTIARGYGLV